MPYKKWSEIKRSKGVDMAEVLRFEDKVRDAMRAVMKHAVAGHGEDTLAGLNAHNGKFNTFCNDPQHALDIFHEAGITPMNTAIVERYLDSGIS